MSGKKLETDVRGFTVLELLIVLLISSIVILVLGTVLASSFEVLRKGETRSQLQSNARNALNYLSDNIASANIIPRSVDRNYNFLDDAMLYNPADNSGDFGIDAEYVVGRPEDVNDPTSPHILPAGCMMSEAFSDRLMLKHQDDLTLDLFNSIRGIKQIQPNLLEFNGQRVSSKTSIFRLAVPTTGNMIYYLSDRLHNRQYSDPASPFPETYSVRNRSESFVLYESMRLELKEYASEGGTPNPAVVGDPAVSFADFDFPIASNITRVKFEYFHRVPVWLVDPNDPDTAYLEDTNDSNGPDSPVLMGWKLVPIDVMDNSRTSWSFDDIYLDPSQFGSQSAYASAAASRFNFWNIDVFYNEPPDRPRDAPFDFYGWLSNGNYGSFEFDEEQIIGVDNNQALDPIVSTDFGNCDGIPDGDGIPDEPVPAWWLPYLSAIRITVVATPNAVIDERVRESGRKTDPAGRPVYYNPDSPIPYSDPSRTIPLTNLKDLYIGEGKDVVVSRMVYPELTYKRELAIYPNDTRIGIERRADYNTIMGEIACLDRSTSPIDTGGPFDVRDRYWELREYDDRN